MDNILFEIAKQSPVAIVALFAIYRMSVVMISIAEGLVKIATQNTESIAEVLEAQNKLYSSSEKS